MTNWYIAWICVQLTAKIVTDINNIVVYLSYNRIRNWYIYYKPNTCVLKFWEFNINQNKHKV